MYAFFLTLAFLRRHRSQARLTGRRRGRSVAGDAGPPAAAGGGGGGGGGGGLGMEPPPASARLAEERRREDRQGGSAYDEPMAAGLGWLADGGRGRRNKRGQGFESGRRRGIYDGQMGPPPLPLFSSTASAGLWAEAWPLDATGRPYLQYIRFLRNSTARGRPSNGRFQPSHPSAPFGSGIVPFSAAAVNLM
ncbi:hypothetical protein CDD83_4069 [Cordyceps sp. RAO-2017]|nr:hypothetical protein CDD83_4069 [Cordyceps sp. RAO-2017]